jgi:hypothetical protein
VPKREEAMSKDRKVYKEKLHSLYYSPNITSVTTSRMSWVMTFGMYRGESAYNIMVGKPEGKWPLGRPPHRRQDNIKIQLEETGFHVCVRARVRVCVRERENWSDLAQYRDKWWDIVNTVMRLCIP